MKKLILIVCLTGLFLDLAKADSPLGLRKKEEGIQAPPPPESEDFSDVPARPDDNLGTFQKGKGRDPNNKHSAKVKGAKFTAPVITGNGCPEGTVGMTLSPDSRTLSVLFDHYQVQAGKTLQIKKDVKTCTLRIPVDVPAGYQFAIVKLDYRGYHLIPERARVNYLSIYSFIDTQTGKQLGRRIRRQMAYRGPLDEEYTLSSDVSSSPIWSRCGRPVQLRIDTRAVAVTNNRGDDVLGMIDSMDASVENGGVQYHLLWQNCL